MQITIDEGGVLRIKAESSLETYALDKFIADAWIEQEDFMRSEPGHWRSTKIDINSNVEKKGVGV